MYDILNISRGIIYLNISRGINENVSVVYNKILKKSSFARKTLEKSFYYYQKICKEKLNIK